MSLEGKGYHKQGFVSYARGIPYPCKKAPFDLSVEAQQEGASCMLLKSSILTEGKMAAQGTMAMHRKRTL